MKIIFCDRRDGGRRRLLYGAGFVAEGGELLLGGGDIVLRVEGADFDVIGVNEEVRFLD